MSFKEALGIEDTSWVGIGRHLSGLVGSKLNNVRKTPSELAIYLKKCGFTDIKLEHVTAYLNNEASFGCFFHHLMSLLNIPLSSVFQSSTSELYQQNMSGLEAYLSELSLESVEHFLIYPRDEALRRHVATYLIQRYDNPDQNLCYVMTLKGVPMGFDKLKEAALKEIKAEENYTESTEFFFNNCNLRIFLHDNDSYTVHFVPKPKVIDIILVEDARVDLDVWKDIYENHSFSNAKSKQLFNLFLYLGGGDPTKLVPRRSLSDPELFEIFCRLGLYEKASRGELQMPSCITVSNRPSPGQPEEIDSIYETYKLHARMAVSKLFTDNILELLKH